MWSGSLSCSSHQERSVNRTRESIIYMTCTLIRSHVHSLRHVSYLTHTTNNTFITLLWFSLSLSLTYTHRYAVISTRTQCHYLTRLIIHVHVLFLLIIHVHCTCRIRPIFCLNQHSNLDSLKQASYSRL